MASAEDKDLDALIRRTDASIARLDKMQQGGSREPLRKLVARRARSRPGDVFNVLVAATCCAVAVHRLDQKNQHEAARHKWEDAQRRLEIENQRLREELAGRQGWLGGLFGVGGGGSKQPGAWAAATGCSSSSSSGRSSSSSGGSSNEPRKGPKMV